MLKRFKCIVHRAWRIVGVLALAGALVVTDISGSLMANAQQGRSELMVATMDGAAANSDSFPNNQDVDEAFARYVNHRDGVFDLESAQVDGVDEQILEVGRIYNLMIGRNDHCLSRDQINTYPQGYARASIDWAGLGITERWNWCGRDRTNGGAPHNSADRVCMNHDRCLSRAKADMCACDRNFVNGMRSVKGSYRGVDRIYIEAAIRAVPRFHNCKIN